MSWLLLVDPAASGARNMALDAPVAIKVVRASGDKAQLRSRLLQEARAAAKLTHPAIVKVFDVGQTETGDPFIVMELLHGDSLGNLLETQGRFAATQAVQFPLRPIARPQSAESVENNAGNARCRISAT